MAFFCSPTGPNNGKTSDTSGTGVAPGRTVIYNVGGNLSGLPVGESVMLALYLRSLGLTADGEFIFATAINPDSSCNV